MNLFTTAYTLPDGEIEIVRRPGVPMPGTANEAIIQATRQIPYAAQVLVIGPGATATAAWAARNNATLTYWTENIAEAHSLTATFEGNHLTLPQAYLQADFKGLKAGEFDLVLLHLPRGHNLQEEILKLAAAVLKPGGQLVFVGAKREGVKSALILAKTIFGRAGIVVHKGSYHAGIALRPKNKTYTIPELTYQKYEVVLNDTPIPLVSCTGVFAENRLDDGAAALIAGMKIEPGARVLDLGCGTGVVGLMAR
ncbi:MAG: methyltransferase, partial [Anaerolineae bacterium]|nr:methyltransferase [Anaerolineae bacterium]